MTQRLDKILRAALWLLLAVTLGSCSQIYDDEGICEQEQGVGNRVSLKFKIYTDYNPSRSRGLGLWEEQPANVAERILNPKDVRVLILNADGHLVRSLKPTDLEDIGNGVIGVGISGDGYYDLEAFFEDENLDRMDDDYEIEFQLMILANINSLGGIYTTDAMLSGTLREKLQEVFTMPVNWYPSKTNGIPMYGYKDNIKATKAELTRVDGFDVGTIYMLRAMSKIEVFDKIEATTLASDGKRYPYVEKVELVSWRDKGNIRPSHEGYSSSLSVSNIPYPTSEPTTTTITAPFVNDLLAADAPSPVPGKDDGVFRFYCPEAFLREMKFQVLAALAPNEPTKYYEVSLEKYAAMVDDNGNKIFGDALVRNHIYRFSVNSLGAKADLTVTVSDWDHQEQTHTLDDIISMDKDGYLTWTNTADKEGGNSNLSLSEEHGEKQLSFLGGTTDYATGTFKINSPEGATWRAFFIPGENGVDAFEFVDVVTGSTSSYVEGVIDGKPVTIHIRGKGQADAYRHTAKLVVEVHQADGSVLYAPIAGPGSTSYIIYRENKL